MAISIDGGILAGGMASRMDGVDKALVKYRGQTMLELIAGALRPHIETLWINTRHRDPQYDRISKHQCIDIFEGQPGPLAGIHSLLQHSKADYLLVSPCDTPKLRQSYGERMREALTLLHSAPEPPRVLAARSGSRYHCLHLCLSHDLTHSLEAYLKSGGRKVFTWLESVNVHWIDFDDCAEQFENINEFSQLKQ